MGQNRYWEHLIRDEDDFNIHLIYIHYNPLKHGTAQNVKDWEYSSFHKFVEQGLYDKNWGSGEDIKNIKDLNFEFKVCGYYLKSTIPAYFFKLLQICLNSSFEYVGSFIKDWSYIFVAANF